MTPICGKSYFYHYWNARGICERCEISAPVLGMPIFARLEDDRFEIDAHEPSRPVDRHPQSDSPLVLVDPASSAVADDLLSSGVLLDLQAFLRRRLVVVP